MTSDFAGVNTPAPVAEGVTLLRCPNPGPMTLDGTNTYLLQAPGGALIVDPGPADPEHVAAVAAAVRGERVAAVVLTHGHADHSGGAAALARLVSAPVLARHREVGRPLPASGKTVDGVLTVLDAPGHTADSVCFSYRRTADEPNYLLTGDTVLGRGTTVVAHPDGRLGDYLKTLEMLARHIDRHRPHHLLPGHGPVRDDAAVVLEYYLRHRLERLTAIRAALADGHRTPDQVVDRVYRDVAPPLRPAAERSVRAQLAYLAGESA